MLIKFAKEGYNMVEIPTTYKARKYGKPKLKHLSQESKYLAQYFGDCWMQILLESVKKIGRKIGLNDEKGYVIAIFLVLIIVSAWSLATF